MSDQDHIPAGPYVVTVQVYEHGKVKFYELCAIEVKSSTGKNDIYVCMSQGGCYRVVVKKGIIDEDTTLFFTQENGGNFSFQIRQLNLITGDGVQRFLFSWVWHFFGEKPPDGEIVYNEALFNALNWLLQTR